MGKWFMVGPAVVIGMRIACFVLRIVLVKNGITAGVLSESQLVVWDGGIMADVDGLTVGSRNVLGILVAEIVLVSIGFLFLVDGATVLWEYQRDRQPEEHEHTRLLNKLLS
jgi:hypothetical protein